MSQTAVQKSRAKKFKPVGIIFAALGLALFAYFVKKTGVAEIVGGIKRLGAGFLIVLALAGFRKLVRVWAWLRCFEERDGLRFRDAFKAMLVGDALGNLMPLGIVVSEPTKAAFVRRRVPLISSLSALAVENLFYSLSVIIFIVCGMATLLLSFPLPKLLRYASIGWLIGTAVILPAAYFVIRRQWKFLSGALDFLYGRGIGKKLLETRRERVRSLEDRIYGFYVRNRRRFLPIFLLEASFHLSGVAEAYITLSFISRTIAPTLLMAFMFESVNRVINVVFKVVPLRAGVDELFTGPLAKLLQFGSATGVTLAVIRKARDICWTAPGIILLIHRGLSLRNVAEETQEGIEAELNSPRAAQTVAASETR